MADYEDDDLEAPDGDCPVCNEGRFMSIAVLAAIKSIFAVLVDSSENSGRVLACGHEICFGKISSFLSYIY